LKGEIKKDKWKYFIPKDEALRLIFKKAYDDVNIKTKAGDSVN